MDVNNVDLPHSDEGSDPINGRVLDERYELFAAIGSGGMATMYRARDRRLGRTVAVKVLRPQYATDSDFLDRFQREAEFAAGLSAHPNIVSVYDVGRDGDLHYMVMEMVEGENLKAAISAYSPMSVDRAFHIAAEIASALDFAHRHGLVHRDVKPQNIIISRDGVVKVTDFGIAYTVGTAQVTKAGVVMGTAHYLSPEQAHGRPAGPGSDVYALGVVLFEMLTGRLPFDADNTIALAMKHIRETPPSPSQYNPKLPPSVDPVVLKALAKDPKRRYATAAEFREALQRPRAVQDTSFMRPIKPRGWWRSHAVGVLATCLVLFVCTAGGVASYDKISALVAGHPQHAATGKKGSTATSGQKSGHHKAPVKSPPKPPAVVPSKTTVALPATSSLTLTYIHTDNINVPPGSGTNLIYTIVDRSSESFQVALAATWVSDTKPPVTLTDNADAAVVTVTPGTHTYTRQFQVPATANPGTYDLVASIESPTQGQSYGTVHLAHLFAVGQGSPTDATTTIQTPTYVAIPASLRLRLIGPPPAGLFQEGPALPPNAKAPGRVVSALRSRRGGLR